VRADQELALPVAAVGEGVGFVDHEILEAAVAEDVAFFHGVVPADHALATGAGAELDFLELDGERMGVVHLREEAVGADLGVVGFGDAEGVDGLHGDAGALEKLGRVGVRGGDVGREAVAFIEPVGLPEFPDDGVAGADFAENEFADFADVFREALAGLPVDFGEALEIDREGRGAAELGEIEFGVVEAAELDALGVGAEFGGR
jgi:hypothetical protein